MNFTCVKKFEAVYDKYIFFITADEIIYPDYLNKENKKMAELLVKENKFKGEISQKIEMTFLQDKKLMTLVLAGLGEVKKMNPKSTRQSLYDILSEYTGKVFVSFSDKKLEITDALAEVTEHTNYHFDKYLSKKKETFLSVFYCTEQKIPKRIEGYELAKISNIVRDLINEQAEVLTPKALAENVVELGKEFSFEVEVLDEKKVEKLGMKSYLSVARAAFHRPYLIVMRYKGNKQSSYLHGLVGKGLTYDTGGLSLKPTDGMLGMKQDMGGGATMIGTMCALAKMKVKKNVICVIAACENSIGPNAYRPGDVVNTMNGKTVEVTNTDAEGRLTLIDAFTYIIRKEKVDEIVDAATLTGAVMVALGEDVTGVFSNNEEAAKEFIKGSDNWYEYFWQMPMYDIFKRNLKSDIADMQNTGSRMGGSVNAAKFLEEFVEGKKWIHLDIAGTSYANGGNPYYKKKGATGQVFRTIYSYIKG